MAALSAVQSPERVAERLAGVRRRIEQAGGGPDVVVLAVTKGFGPDAIDAATSAGCGQVGENYAQELLAKLAGLRGSRPEIHFIGRLQSNKVKALAGVVDVWQTVDRPSLVDELARRAGGARVMVEVNVTDEPQKGGCPPSDAAALVARARDAGLSVEGLMTVGRAGPPELARAGLPRPASAGRRARDPPSLDGDERGSGGGCLGRVHDGAGRDGALR